MRREDFYEAAPEVAALVEAIEAHAQVVKVALEEGGPPPTPEEVRQVAPAIPAEWIGPARTALHLARFWGGMKRIGRGLEGVLERLGVPGDE